MSAQRLGEKKTRRIARETGLDVIRAWSHGGYTMAFVTRDHQHGWFDLKTGTAEVPDQWGTHYSSCVDIDPAEPSGYRDES